MEYFYWWGAPSLKVQTKSNLVPETIPKTRNENFFTVSKGEDTGIKI